MFSQDEAAHSPLQNRYGSLKWWYYLTNTFTQESVMLMCCPYNLCQFQCALLNSLLHLVEGPLPLSASQGAQALSLLACSIRLPLVYSLWCCQSCILCRAAQFQQGQQWMCVSSPFSFLQSSLLYNMLMSTSSWKWEQKDAISRGSGKPYT